MTATMKRETVGLAPTRTGRLLIMVYLCSHRAVIDPEPLVKDIEGCLPVTVYEGAAYRALIDTVVKTQTFMDMPTVTAGLA